MPIFFVGYALIVWALAARYRRRPAGYLAVAIGFSGLMSLNLLHIKLNDWTEGEIFLPVLQSIMYPYTAFVTGIGVYIACLPHRSNRGCAWCGYDLHGLGSLREPCRCPECGKVAPAEHSYRRSGVDRADLRSGDRPSSSNHAVQHAENEDQRGQTGHEAPSQATHEPV
ncbi:MAG: hypothetical protein CMJ31_10645 [Phycisphaerae bacterium]|nr:hypothetical protein [Phycisphaerae bacterium]